MVFYMLNFPIRVQQVEKFCVSFYDEQTVNMWQNKLFLYFQSTLRVHSEGGIDAFIFGPRSAEDFDKRSDDHVSQKKNYMICCLY